MGHFLYAKLNNKKRKELNCYYYVLDYKISHSFVINISNKMLQLQVWHVIFQKDANWVEKKWVKNRFPFQQNRWKKGHFNWGREKMCTPQPLYNTIFRIQANFRTKLCCIESKMHRLFKKRSYLGSSLDACYTQNHVITNHVIKRFRWISHFMAKWQNFHGQSGRANLV